MPSALISEADADFQAARTGDTPLLWAANHAQPSRPDADVWIALAARLGLMAWLVGLGTMVSEMNIVY